MRDQEFGEQERGSWELESVVVMFRSRGAFWEMDSDTEFSTDMTSNCLLTDY